jgi:hypothetical protein
MASNHPADHVNPAKPAHLTSNSAEPSAAEMAPSNTSSNPVRPADVSNKLASIRKDLEDAAQDLEEWLEEQGITTDSEEDGSSEKQQSDP